MRTVLVSLAIVLFCSLLFPADGTIPRIQASNYPSHTEIAGVEVGALLLKEPEVKKRFSAKIGDEYLVVEVALYPRKGERVEVNPDNIILRLSGTEVALRPENPRVVAGALERNGGQGRGVRVIPQARVGIDTGPRYPDPRYDPNYPGTDPTYDPRYDPRYPRQGGVSTSTGVGVILGESRPGTSPRRADADGTELAEKSLPSGPASRPVAGHLYYRVDRKTQQDRNSHFSLDIEIAGSTARLPL